MHNLISASHIPWVPFYFMRHGETAWNSKSLLMGATDVELSAAGKRQIYDSLSYLNDINFNTVCSSPLKRCTDSASIICKHFNLTLVEEEKLGECDWGPYEGVNIYSTPILSQWEKEKAIAGVEPYQDFARRVFQGIASTLQYPKPVLVISHSAVYHVIRHLLSLPYMELSNGAVVCHQPPIKEGCPWFSYVVNDD